MDKDIVLNINRGNKALEFIDQRILDNRYRGLRSSQHNRYTIDKIVKILRLLNKYVPKRKLMTIRTTDISKRPINTVEEREYASFCNEAKATVGIGTQDAMRKNIFVDLHRMGLICRYDKDRSPTDPISHQTVKYVALTQMGLRFISASNILDQYFIFSKCVDKMLGGYINIILNILRDSEYNIDKLSIHEFMFFVSAVDTNTSFNINIEKCVDLIKEYRNLSRIQRRSVIEVLKNKLKPENYLGSKRNKRDFHNWLNKSTQIFTILNQTVYFEISNNEISLKANSFGVFNNINDINIKRSTEEKAKYFQLHNVNKSVGFELHHVVPLSWSESVSQFKLLDNWLNMVYIDAFSHAKVTQQNNRNIVLVSNNKDLILQDFDDNQINLIINKNIIYSYSNQTVMLNYNNELLNTMD